jgi:pimeloyl-ACP methyl ester carboxylesterase
VGDRGVPRAEDRLAPDGPVTREWGPPDGEPLVFWPGLNPWGDLQLIEVGPRLGEHGYRVVAIAPPWDLPEPDDYLPSRLADYVLCLLPDERFVFMGASWGGSIGVQLAADHPERLRGLVLFDAGYRDVDVGGATPDELAAQFEADQAGFSFESWDAFFAYVQSRVRNWRPSLEPRYREGMEERDGRIVARPPARVAAWAMHGAATEKQTATHGRLHVSVLLLLADDAEGSIPTAETHRLDAGHDVIEDAPDETVSLVVDWLARLPVDADR